MLSDDKLGFRNKKDLNLYATASDTSLLYITIKPMRKRIEKSKLENATHSTIR